MAEPDEPGIEALAQAVADGSSVDWELAESSAQTPEERQVIRQLRRLADIGQAARAHLTSWGPLDIRSEIGSGAFGTVYRAWDRRLEREVALKLLGASETDRALASTVISEGRLLARIHHANIVTVHGADVFDGRAGIWMELVHGRTLKAIVTEQGPFGPQEAANIGRDLCRALAAVHGRGYLHRDVKAQNVMREAGGRTVLMDFGGGGTPVYLAPEILDGSGSPTVKSDLYALGVLLFFLVSGEFPVTGTSLDDLRDRHARGQRTLLRDIRPDLSSEFHRAVDSATAPNPADRPDSAGAMELLLEQALGLRAEIVGTRPSKGMQARFGTRWLAAGALLVLIVMLMAVGWSRWGWSGTRPPPRSSVAILPFKNLTPGEHDDYFSEGITQDVVAHLATLPDLRVIAGASALRARGKSATEIGTELNVAAVLDGSVRRDGDQIRIVSQLVDATNGEQLWSESFERNLQDVFAMQAEVSRKIALALRGELSSREADRLNASRGHDFDAFNLYLKGRHSAALRTEDGLQRATQLHQQAIQRDPTFALAYAGLADAYTSLGTYGFLPRDEAFVRAEDAAKQAVALDPTLAEAHVSLAYAHKNRFEWKDAEAHFKRAIELRPGLAQAHHWYSIYLNQQGRFPEAIVEVKTALSLDPLSIGANLQLADVLLMERRYEDAIAQWQRALQMDPNFLIAYRGIASAYTYLGLYDRALNAAADAAKHAPLGAEDQELKADVGYLLAVSGRRDEALRIVHELTARHRATGEMLTGTIAALYTGLGDKEQAFTWLTRARALRDPEVGFLKVDPRWDPLRGDPRFTALLTSLGFETDK